MRSGIFADNNLDEDGNPAGGTVSGTGISIRWQNGPLGPPGSPERAEPNGAFVEDVIEAAAQRIEHYQHTKFWHPLNAVALGHLRAAMEVLEQRTLEREQRGVEGTHEQ